MNVNKAKEYADGKVVEALNQVVENAYLAGYNAGYQDGINKVVKDSALEKTEYVDLGLPSGTLWASSYVEDEKGNAIYLTQEELIIYLPLSNGMNYKESVNGTRIQKRIGLNMVITIIIVGQSV